VIAYIPTETTTTEAWLKGTMPANAPTPARAATTRSTTAKARTIPAMRSAT
jgi:hypothetical protein